MADFSIPEVVRQVLDIIPDFIDREVVPLEKEHRDLLEDERKRYQPDGRLSPEVLELKRYVRKKSSEAGIYTMFGDPELGGGGFGPTAALYVQELLGRRYGPGRVLISDVVIPSPFTNGLTPLLKALNPEVRDPLLPGIASGEITLCFGLTEPDAGSDVFNIRTTATKDGNEWVLNGTKQFITNAPYADYAMIFAITDPELKEQRKGGITCFWVDTRTPGFQVDSVIRFMGHLGGEAGIVSLNNVRVPESCIMGEFNQGFRLAMLGIDTGRLGLSGKCIGLSQWALDQALAYAEVRRTFGKPIAEHQSIQNLLADCAIDIYAAKNMAIHCAWLVEQGKRAYKEISMCKVFATEMASRVYDRCIQIHGGIGLTNDLRLQEGYRYVRILRVPDGTSEIHRRTIARRLLRGEVDF